MMGFVVLVALGAAALRYPSATMSAVVSFISARRARSGHRRSGVPNCAERAWWLGFAALGWMYVGLQFRFLYSSQILSSTIVLKLLAPLLGVPIEDRMPFRGDRRREIFLGSGITCWLCWPRSAAGSWPEPSSVLPEQGRLRRRRLLAVRRRGYDAVVDFAGDNRRCGIVADRLNRRRLRRIDPGISAGATYLLTWWLIGLTAIGALFGHGRRREFSMAPPFSARAS